MKIAFIWLAVALVIASLPAWIDRAEAQKRRPNGCDWIGGDFAEPGEVIFNTGCRKSAPRRAPAESNHESDKPPQLLDRKDAKAPVNFGASTRKSVGAGIEGFEIVSETIAYGLDGGANLWRVSLGGKDSLKVAQSISAFRDVVVGSLYLLEKDRTLWRAKEDGSDRAFIDHEVQDFQPVGDLVYIIGTDKRLWRLHPDGKTRDHVDDAVSAFHAVDSKTVFVLGTDGALWRENGDAHDRVKIGQPITAFSYVTDGDAKYVLTPNHILWRQKGKDAPEQVDHDVAAFHPVDMNLVYVLATDGRLWQELGERSHAVLVDGDLAVKLGANAFQFASTGDITGQPIYLLDRKHELWSETMPSARGAPAAH